MPLDLLIIYVINLMHEFDAITRCFIDSSIKYPLLAVASATLSIYRGIRVKDATLREDLHAQQDNENNITCNIVLHDCISLCIALLKLIVRNS
jgi:hypothetical protein